MYPDCTAAEAAIEAEAWFEGKDVQPLLMKMETKYKKAEKASYASSGGLKKGGGLKGMSLLSKVCLSYRRYHSFGRYVSLNIVGTYFCGNLFLLFFCTKP